MLSRSSRSHQDCALRLRQAECPIGICSVYGAFVSPHLRKLIQANWRGDQRGPTRFLCLQFRSRKHLGLWVLLLNAQHSNSPKCPRIPSWGNWPDPAKVCAAGWPILCEVLYDSVYRLSRHFKGDSWHFGLIRRWLHGIHLPQAGSSWSRNIPQPKAFVEDFSAPPVNSFSHDSQPWLHEQADRISPRNELPRVRRSYSHKQPELAQIDSRSSSNWVLSFWNPRILFPFARSTRNRTNLYLLLGAEVCVDLSRTTVSPTINATELTQ